jgi:hypothetical protein
LADEPVNFGAPDAPELPENEVRMEPGNTYHDVPRFNLWLPIPLETTNVLAPGATVLLQSLLGRHSIGISAAWDIAGKLPVAAAFHNYQRGPISVVTQGSLNNRSADESRYHVLSSQVMFPLSRRFGIDGTRVLMGSAALGATFREHETVGTVFGYLGYGYTSPTSPRDYFGRYRYAALASLQHDRSLTTGASRTIPIVSLAAQVPLWNTHHAFAFEIDGAYVGPGYTGDILPAEVLGVQRASGEAKALVTARYKIPFSPLDQPIPFGGILGAGLSLHAQSAIYLDQGRIDWEEDVYLGATLHAGIAIGGAFTLQPFAAFAVSSATGEWRLAAGLGVETLFTGIGERTPYFAALD